jgi:tight adherence protein B
LSWPAFGAAAATVVALWLARPPARWVIRVRLGSDTTSRAGLRRSVGRLERLGLTVAVVGAGVATSRISFVIVAGTMVGAALFVLRQVRLARSRSALLQTRAQVIAALDLLAAELRAGILPQRAIEALADDAPVLRPAAAAAAHGGDVASALQAASAEPGAGALADLAGAWHVAEHAGAPLADVLDRVATAARDDADVDRDVQAEAAPARATGRLMAVLPVLGLSLGAGMGADPVHILTGTVLGATCLAAGVALACTGVVWVDRIVASVDTA